LEEKKEELDLIGRSPWKNGLSLQQPVQLSDHEERGTYYALSNAV